MNTHYRCAVLLDPGLPFAPHPPAPSPYHIAAAYQWFKLPDFQVVNSGKLAQGEGVGVPTIVQGDKVSFAILDFKNQLQIPKGPAPNITIKFGQIEPGWGTGSPFSSPINSFSYLPKVKYGGKSGIEVWYTQPYPVVRPGRYAFTVDMDGDTDFYLDPEMDIGS